MASYDETRGVWRLRAEANLPGEKRKRQIVSFCAPNTAKGRKLAEAEEIRFRDKVFNTLNFTYAGSFAQYADGWMARNREDWSPKTTAHVERTLRVHIYPHIGASQLDLVTVEDVEDMYLVWATEGGREGTGYSKVTRRRYHGIVRAVFSDALRRGSVERDPMVRVKAAGKLSTDTPRPVLSPEQITAIIDAAPSTDAKMFFTIGARTGARRNSIHNLRWRDIDLDRATIHFTVTKEDKPYTVPIDADLVVILRAFRIEAAERALSLGLSLPDCYVFTDRVPFDRPYHEAWASHVWRATADKLGLDGFRLHDLRHFCASRLLSRGLSYAAVARRLGCTENNVNRTYSHLVDHTDGQHAADIMGELFALPSPADEGEAHTN